MATSSNSIEFIFNSVSDLIFISNPKGEIIEINNAALKALGYSVDYLNSKPITIIHPHEFEEEVNGYIKQAINGVQQQTNIPLLSKYGKHLLVETHIYYGQWKSQEAIIAVCTIIPSGEHNLEANLLNSFEDSSSLMAIYNLEKDKITNINTTFAKVLGYTKKELLNQSASQLKFFEQAEDKNSFVDILFTKKRIINEYIILVSKKGVRVHTLFTALITTFGANKYLLISAHDISDKLNHNRNHIDSLHKTESKLSIVEDYRLINGENTEEKKIYCAKQYKKNNLLDVNFNTRNSFMPLWKWDIPSCKFTCNDAAMADLSCASRKIFTNNPKEMIHPKDLAIIEQRVLEHIEKRTPYFCYCSRIQSNKHKEKWMWVYVQGKVILWDNQNKPIEIMGTLFNVDPIKQSEDELRTHNASKDQLFSIIAHDLKGHIGTMKQLSEFIIDNNELSKEDIDEFHYSQKELSANTYNLIDNLLTWARANLNQIAYLPLILNVNNVFSQIIADLGFYLKAKNIQVLFKPEGTNNAFADENMLKVIIRNILSNAIKFSPMNGVIEIVIEKKRTLLHVIISDNGKGITPENIEKILSNTDFYSSHGTMNEKGNGLGLKLCKSFIERNRGKLSIKSEINVGTSLMFTLPTIQK